MIIIPSYFYPGPEWDKLLAGDTRNIASVIINPDSGAGSTRNPEYANLCVKLRKKGVPIAGYIYTNWGARPMFEVDHEINDYRRWYSITDVFLDEVSVSVSDLRHYQDLYKAIHGRVILNHGCVPPEEYYSAGDILVISESNQVAHAQFACPDWLKAHRSKNCEIVYGCSPEKVFETRQKIFVLSDYEYVTDAAMPNPYDRLPSSF